MHPRAMAHACRRCHIPAAFGKAWSVKIPGARLSECTGARIGVDSEAVDGRWPNGLSGPRQSQEILQHLVVVVVELVLQPSQVGHRHPFGVARVVAGLHGR